MYTSRLSFLFEEIPICGSCSSVVHSKVSETSAAQKYLEIVQETWLIKTGDQFYEDVMLISAVEIQDNLSILTKFGQISNYMDVSYLGNV